MKGSIALACVLFACGKGTKTEPTAGSAGATPGSATGSAAEPTSSLVPALAWLVGTYDLPVTWKETPCTNVRLQGDKLAYKLVASGSELVTSGLVTSHGELRARVEPVAGGFKASGSVPLESGEDLPPDEQNEVFTLNVTQNVTIDGAKVTGTVLLEVSNPGGMVGCTEEGTIAGTRNPATPAPPTAAQPTAKPEPAAVGGLDCTKLVTAGDIKKVCGKDVTLESQPSKFHVCQLFMRGGIEGVELRGSFKVYRPETPEQLKSELTRVKPEGSQPLAGVGEEAWTRYKKSDLAGEDFKVGARKGPWLLEHSAAKAFHTPPCTLDQMVEITKLAVSRLP